MINNFKDCEGKWSIYKPKTYFDMYSHEFKSMDIREMLNNLGFLINEGMGFPEIIMNYCDIHSHHTIDAVKPTLLCYLQLMRWGEPTHFSDSFFDNMTEVEMSILTQDEIKLRYVIGEVYCSNWNRSIEKEMIKRAANNNTKLAEILQNSDFSKEFQYKYKP